MNKFKPKKEIFYPRSIISYEISLDIILRILRHKFDLSMEEDEFLKEFPEGYHKYFEQE